jgi:hypothetical protein
VQATFRAVLAVVERKQRSVRGVRSGDRGGHVIRSSVLICFRGNFPIKKKTKIYCENPLVFQLAGIECR